MDHGQFERLLRVGEVAGLLGVSVSTVWRHVADGSLPEPVRFGGVTRWAQSELILYLEALKAGRSEVGSNASTHPVR